MSTHSTHFTYSSATSSIPSTPSTPSPPTTPTPITPSNRPTPAQVLQDLKYGTSPASSSAFFPRTVYQTPISRPSSPPSPLLVKQWPIVYPAHPEFAPTSPEDSESDTMSTPTLSPNPNNIGSNLTLASSPPSPSSPYPKHSFQSPRRFCSPKSCRICSRNSPTKAPPTANFDAPCSTPKGACIPSTTARLQASLSLLQTASGNIAPANTEHGNTGNYVDEGEDEDRQTYISDCHDEESDLIDLGDDHEDDNWIDPSDLDNADESDLIDLGDDHEDDNWTDPSDLDNADESDLIELHSEPDSEIDSDVPNHTNTNLHFPRSTVSCTPNTSKYSNTSKPPKHWKEYTSPRLCLSTDNGDLTFKSCPSCCRSEGDIGIRNDDGELIDYLGDFAYTNASSLTDWISCSSSPSLCGNTNEKDIFTSSSVDALHDTTPDPTTISGYTPNGTTVILTPFTPPRQPSHSLNPATANTHRPGNTPYHLHIVHAKPNSSRGRRLSPLPTVDFEEAVSGKKHNIEGEKEKEKEIELRASSDITQRKGTRFGPALREYFPRDTVMNVLRMIAVQVVVVGVVDGAKWWVFGR